MWVVCVVLWWRGCDTGDTRLLCFVCQQRVDVANGKLQTVSGTLACARIRFDLSAITNGNVKRALAYKCHHKRNTYNFQQK